MKRCLGCLTEKALEEFQPFRRGDKTYRRGTCRECYRALHRQYYAENPERYRGYARDQYQKDIEASRRRSAAKARAGGDALRTRRRELRAANPDSARASARRWKSQNPHRTAVLNLRRRALLLSAFVEDVHPLIVLERDDGVCGICGDDVDPFRFHVDHIVPLAAGGLHAYFNVQAAHPHCNLTKGAKVVA